MPPRQRASSSACSHRETVSAARPNKWSDGGEGERHSEQGEEKEQRQQDYETRGEVVQSAGDCEP